MTIHKKISLPTATGKLEGILHFPDVTPRGIAVVAHPLPTMGGTMDNKVVTTLAKALIELGYATVRFNFRGVGESEGSYDEGNGETSDAMAVVDFMREEYPDLPLLLAGFSFGAYVQARVAEQVHPQQLVLIAPAVSRFAMPEVPADTLVVHGDMDEVVDLQALLQWARPQQLPVTVLTGAEHFFHGRLIQLKKIVMRHLAVSVSP